VRPIHAAARRCQRAAASGSPASAQWCALDVLDDPRDGRVAARPAVAELRFVGYLLGQRVLEGVLDLRIQLCLVEELALLQNRGGSVQLRLRELGAAAQERQRNPLADHRGHLQHVLLALLETIDACSENRLHRQRNSQAFDRPCQLIGATPPCKRTGLDQALHDLFNEVRVAAGTRTNQLR
jgi:hypothetical protein